MQVFPLKNSITGPGFFSKSIAGQAYTSPEAEYGKKMRHFVADELFPQFTDSNHLIFEYQLSSSS